MIEERVVARAPVAGPPLVGPEPVAPDVVEEESGTRVVSEDERIEVGPDLPSLSNAG